jgi:hypothetical protein
MRLKGCAFWSEVLDAARDVLFRVEHLVIVCRLGSITWKLELIDSFLQVPRSLLDFLKRSSRATCI